MIVCVDVPQTCVRCLQGMKGQSGRKGLPGDPGPQVRLVNCLSSSELVH